MWPPSSKKAKSKTLGTTGQYSIYKIYAALLRNRLIAGLDERISNTQYGFRAKRSTSQPILATRRIIDITEAAGDITEAVANSILQEEQRF